MISEERAKRNKRILAEREEKKEVIEKERESIKIAQEKAVSKDPTSANAPGYVGYDPSSKPLSKPSGPGPGYKYQPKETLLDHVDPTASPRVTIDRELEKGWRERPKRPNSPFTKIADNLKNEFFYPTQGILDQRLGNITWHSPGKDQNWLKMSPTLTKIVKRSYSTEKPPRPKGDEYEPAHKTSHWRLSEKKILNYDSYLKSIKDNTIPVIRTPKRDVSDRTVLKHKISPPKFLYEREHGSNQPYNRREHQYNREVENIQQRIKKIKQGTHPQKNQKIKANEMTLKGLRDDYRKQVPAPRPKPKPERRSGRAPGPITTGKTLGWLAKGISMWGGIRKSHK